MKIGKCIICGRKTSDFRGCVREENGIFYDDFQCEECTNKKVKEAREKYVRDFTEKVLPYLAENHFKVVVKQNLIGPNTWKKIEEFPIVDHNIMYCVDVIRNRMKNDGYFEKWIDVHHETYQGVTFEIVDFLSYEQCLDRNKEDRVEFWLELVGDEGRVL